MKAGIYVLLLLLAAACQKRCSHVEADTAKAAGGAQAVVARQR